MAEKKIDIIVIKKTRDVLVIQEGKVMKKYLFDREWEVQEKKERKAKEESKEEIQAAEPKYKAQANELPTCEVIVERMTSHEIQKIIEDGKQKENVRMLQQKTREMACKYFCLFSCLLLFYHVCKFYMYQSESY